MHFPVAADSWPPFFFARRWTSEDCGHAVGRVDPVAVAPTVVGVSPMLTRLIGLRKTRGFGDFLTVEVISVCEQVTLLDRAGVIPGIEGHCMAFAVAILVSL